MNHFIESVLNKPQIYCFGAGAMGKDFADFLLDCGYNLHRFIFIDNDKNKHHTLKEIGNYKIEIQPKEFMFKNITPKDCVVVATLACHEIYEELKQRDELNAIDIYYSQLIFTSILKPTQDFVLQAQTKESIPKIIHYCWFGGKEIPDKWKRFIEGWQEKCPDYEIKRWDESNYDVTKNLYMKQAYEKQRYGFVSDYARLDIVYQYGGIYMDVDVELLKPLSLLQQQKAFFCSGPYLKVNTGCGFGSIPKNPIIKEMKTVYNDKTFINSDLTLNVVPCTEYQHEVLHRHGYRLNGEMQTLEYVTIVPFDVFYGYNHYINKYLITKNTIAVHHSERTWHDKKMRERANKSVDFLNRQNAMI